MAANIEAALAAILTATYGEEVRQALHDALEEALNVKNNTEVITNKVTEITAGSTNSQYASAKAIYDALENRFWGLPFDLTFTAEDVINNCFIGANGAVFNNANWASTDYCYVPLEKGGTLEITSTIYVNGGVAFYDQNKTCLRAITGQNAAEYDYTVSSVPQTRTFTVPENTTYVRICALKSSSSDMSRVSLLRIRKGVGLNQVVNDLGSLKAEAKTVGDKIAELYDMCETYNLYDPTLPYTGMNRTGTASDNLKSKMVIGNNGNITCTASMSNTGSVYVANQGRTLKAGTYTMSGKMTFHDSAPDSVRKVWCDIGRHSSSLIIVLKTQRGGTTNIANSDKEGWFAGTFTIEEDQADFTFMVIPESNAICNTNLPAIISNLQIISGSEIGVYSPNRYTNVDIPLREESSRVLKNSNGIIYTTYTARHTFSVSTATGGLTVTIGGNLNTRLYGDRATKNWEDISSEISDNIVIDGSSATITIPSYSQALVYNAGDKKLHIRNLSQNSGLVIDDIVLVANAYANPVGGCLYNEYIDRMVTDTGDFVHSNEILSRSFNAAYHTGATNFAEKCKEFSTLLKGTIDKSTGNVDVIAPTNFESFLFFTDPHLLEGSAWENRCQEFIAQIQKYYNSTPTSFCLCGGDWLGNSDLPDDACFKLGYIDGFMHSMFDNCYMILGNHDTNYQGKRDASSATYTTRLTNQSLVDLWYRGGKRAYYTFDGANTKFYCLDTQTESDTLWTFNNYGAQQVAWFGNSLLTDNAPHIALAMHILYNWLSANDGVVDSASSSVNPIAAEVVKIAAAYNARSSVTFNGTTYDYSSATGRIEFLICGHAHKDFEVEELAGNGITTLALDFPCIGTLNVRNDESLGASFDLCFADYDNREIKLIRVGSGENRTISLDPAVSG